ncbi:hypothetical protein Droror1_Dr00000857 [Drosera rotundifolia]
MLEDYGFESLPIWVQCGHLPLGYLRSNVAELIGRKVGRILSVDVDDHGETRGNCLRFKVEINITRPLIRGSMVSYDRVPNLCFRCGVIGNRVVECQKVPVWQTNDSSMVPG